MKYAFSVFVYGGYERFLPSYVYAIDRAYPNVDVIIFYKGELSKHVKNFLGTYGQVVLYEKFYEEYDHFKNFKMKGGGGLTLLRYLIPGSYFKTYDYVYFGDVDIIIFKEDINLFEFHEKQMEAHQLPFSNRVRMLPDEGISKRLTGLHMVKVSSYFKKMDGLIKRVLTDAIFRDEQLKHISRDEEFLYHLNKRAFDFSPERLTGNKVPLHGLHLGAFRKGETPLSNPIATLGYYVGPEKALQNLKELFAQKPFRTIVKQNNSIELYWALKYYRVGIPWEVFFSLFDHWFKTLLLKAKRFGKKLLN